MPQSEAEFLAELRQAFAQEAREHLETMTSGLLELERGDREPAGEGVLEEVYRAAHSMKGAARAVNEHEVESLAHAMEDVFTSVRKGRIVLRAEDYDHLQSGLSILESLLAEPDPASVAASQALRNRLHDLCGKTGDQPPAPAETPQAPARKSAPRPASAPASTPPAPPDTAAGQPPTPATAPPPPPPFRPAAPAAAPARRRGEETVRVAVAKLDAFLLKSESLLPAKFTLEHRINEVRELAAFVARTRRDLDGPGPHSPSPQAGDGSRRLARARAGLDAAAEGLGALASRLRADLLAQGNAIRDLLEIAKQVLMFPFSTVAQPFPKMVRDLARDQGKEAELVIAGGEVQVDKRILEELKAPLTHLLRNAVDHGLEAPGEREARGKPRAGSIRITVSEADGDKVEVTVSDDGAGFDLERLRELAPRTLGLTSEQARDLSGEELADLAFRSGVSVSSMVTDISGRGLGLAIVREAVESLGGQIALDTAPGAGTTLRLLLPLTLATFRGILVRSAGRTFVVPSAGVSRVALVPAAEVRTMEGRAFVSLHGRPFSLVRLDEVLGLSPPEGQERPADLPLAVLLLGSSDGRLALAVDQVLGEQDVLVKGLGRHLAGLRNISGATVLGSGAVVPVLNTTDLLTSAARSLAPSPETEPDREAEGPRTVLVVEDSLTSRTLLVNILQSAGYTVRTAVDGLDGLTVLRSEPVDLAVLDVDMPRMNGFELTAAIRRDPRLAELPVVLLTARSSREDRERGIELGANAYLVKSGFDQGNLLDVVRQFL